ncbi:MAG TPA: hypothetical protein VF092_28900, partial [Longimicrobium sp.]
SDDLDLVCSTLASPRSVAGVAASVGEPAPKEDISISTNPDISTSTLHSPERRGFAFAEARTSFDGRLKPRLEHWQASQTARGFNFAGPSLRSRLPNLPAVGLPARRIPAFAHPRISIRGGGETADHRPSIIADDGVIGRAARIVFPGVIP